MPELTQSPRKSEGRALQAVLHFARLGCAGWILLGPGALPGAERHGTPLHKPAREIFLYTGMCDASAAVALGPSLFAVANDEDNQIRIYRAGQSGAPLRSIDLTAFLEVDRRFPETDLEGAARIGEVIYWIGSHGRNQEGKPRESRDRFFGMKISGAAGDVQLTPIGRPYKRLVFDLLSEPRFKRFNLAAAAARPPKARGAINIEGLCATADKTLLIAFRNPIPNGQALLIPMLNPAEVIQGRPARFGEAIQLDLGGLGIRDITFAEGKYLIIAGSYDGSGHAHLYKWSGGDEKPELARSEKFKGFNPEALIVYPAPGHPDIQIISDDGKRSINGTRCKDLKPPAAKQFRSFWVGLD
jgi:hypothetical protein